MSRVLLIGGAGKVATLILPDLVAHHEVHVFDRNPPADPTIAHTLGDVTDDVALRAACTGRDALLFLAMGGGGHWGSPENAAAHFDVSIKGLYLALGAAVSAGIRTVVLASSMSVYKDIGSDRRYFVDEALTPDADDAYGLSKRFGEEVARAFCRRYPDMSIAALRLCLPTADDDWKRLSQPHIATAASDVADAFLRALATPLGGFEPFTIAGDYQQALVRLTRAKALLGWEPRARPEPVSS
jgi:nucleoside-diphosphate-sugar epimerase